MDNMVKEIISNFTYHMNFFKEIEFENQYHIVIEGAVFNGKLTYLRIVTYHSVAYVVVVLKDMGEEVFVDVSHSKCVDENNCSEYKRRFVIDREGFDKVFRNIINVISMR